MIRCMHIALTDIPQDWDKTQIKKIATKICAGGKLKLTKSDYLSKGIPAYSAAGQDGYVHEAEFSSLGVIVSAIGARCGKSFYATGKWTTLANTQVILANESKCLNRFLWYLINDEQYWHRSGTAQPFIKPSDIQNAWIPLPPLYEQKSIVQLLDASYRPVEHHTKIVHHLQEMYQGLLQRLVSGQLFKRRGEKFFLKDLAKVAMGETIIKKDLTQDGIPVFSANTGSEPWGYTSQNKKTYTRGTIVLGARGSIGFPRFPKFEQFTSTQTTISITPNNDCVLPAYLYLYLQTINYKLLTTVQAVPMLTVADMLDVNIYVPSIEEQKSVMALFLALQKKIDLHRTLREKQDLVHEGLKKEVLYGKKRISL